MSAGCPHVRALGLGQYLGWVLLAERLYRV